MRRKEFEKYDEKEYIELMQAEKIGQLGVIDASGYPRIIPVNYIFYNNNIYFHGAMDGEKYELLQKQPKVTFSVYQPYSYIPSYIITNIACEATIFFKSVHIRGRGLLVDDFNEKIKILNALMEKHQPEKKYEDIDLSNPKYYHYMETTSIFCISPSEITVKLKFGQNLGSNVISHIISYLEQRKEPIDLETVKEIKKRRPI